MPQLPAEAGVCGLRVLLYACRSGDLSIMSALLQSLGANALRSSAEIIGSNGIIRPRTPLAAACDGGSVDAVNLLLESGADVHQAFGPHASTALHVAAQHGNVAVVDRLLEARADADWVGNGPSPLYIASQNGNITVVQQLMLHNADVNRTDGNGHTPAFIANREGHPAVVEQLLAPPSDAPIAVPCWDQEQPGALGKEAWSILESVWEDEWMRHVTGQIMQPHCLQPFAFIAQRATVMASVNL